MNCNHYKYICNHYNSFEISIEIITNTIEIITNTIEIITNTIEINEIFRGKVVSNSNGCINLRDYIHFNRTGENGFK